MLRHNNSQINTRLIMLFDDVLYLYNTLCSSHQALDAAQLKELKAALGGFIKPGENILLETLVSRARRQYRVGRDQDSQGNNISYVEENNFRFIFFSKLI